MKSIKLNGHALELAEIAAAESETLNQELNALKEKYIEVEARGQERVKELLKPMFDELGVPEELRLGVAVVSTYIQHGDVYLVGTTPEAAAFIDKRGAN